MLIPGLSQEQLKRMKEEALEDRIDCKYNGAYRWDPDIKKLWRDDRSFTNKPLKGAGEGDAHERKC